MKTNIWTSVLLTVLAVCFTLTYPVFSAEPAAKPVAATQAAGEFKTVMSVMQPKDGDTIVFLGDSITHQCLYTQYVEDYFYTRYPKLRIHFHNAGVGGDRAADALVRFDEDVASFKPQYVTVLLGMNDGAYRDFDKAIFDTYQKDMTTLLDRLSGIGAAAIPMTPTMHDARAARLRGKGSEPRDTYYNGVLALYGAWLREVSQARGLGFVDMYTPLNQLTLAERKKDANFTMIPDSVHPGAPGQVVMASAIISDMCPRTSVSSITIQLQPRTGKLVAMAGNGKVADFQADEQGIRFTFAANALPWVLPADAMPGYELLHAGHHYGMEAFIARNLKPGKYELKIDDQTIGTYTDAQLGFRLELETNDKTPQYQQGLKVAMLNKERNDKAVHPLRDMWGQLKRKRSQLNAAAAKNDPELAAKKDQFQKWVTDEFTPGVAKFLAAAKDYEDQIYQANQAPPRKYELTPVK